MEKIDLTERLLEDMGNLCLSESYADMEFVVEGEKLPAHRVVLAVRSEYFRALLYGGMSESTQCQIKLDVRLDLFKLLLEYIYTGNLSIATLKDDVVIDMLGTADQYGFHDLQLAISKYLTQSLTLKNVCVVLDAALLYNLKDLTEACLSFMDGNASDLLQEESFNLLSQESLEMVLQRDTFYAPEGEIFQGVLKWSRSNNAVDTESLWDAVRLPLIGINDLLEVVRPLEILDPNKLLDAISQTRSKILPYRSHLILEKNVATAEYSARCTEGVNCSNLLNGDVINYTKHTGYTYHTISDGKDNAIVVELGAMYNINHIRLLLWDKNLRAYSYFIEVSADKLNWERVIDYSQYHCRSWQYLYFAARPVRFIKIVGTYSNTVQNYRLVSLEAMHAIDVPKLIGHFVSPVDNVATIPMHACVIIDGEIICNTLIDGNFLDCDEEVNEHDYTEHELGMEGIVVRLRQPYHVGSIRLRLWDRSDVTYKFYVETSTNCKDWEMAVDKRNEEVRSWQNFHFTPRTVVYIRIVGTDSSDGASFACIHFECPSQEIE